jgi:predicted transcriptional regulator
MPDLNDIARTVAQERKRLRMTQHELASKARVSRLLVARLETERLPELGVKKLIRRRPTLEDLRAEEEGETS